MPNASYLASLQSVLGLIFERISLHCKTQFALLLFSLASHGHGHFAHDIVSETAFSIIASYISTTFSLINHNIVIFNKNLRYNYNNVLRFHIYRFDVSFKFVIIIGIVIPRLEVPMPTNSNVNQPSDKHKQRNANTYANTYNI